MKNMIDVISDNLSSRPDLFLHEIHGRVDKEVLENYDKNHKINHMYDGRETHFLMNCEGNIDFIGSLYELNGFLSQSKARPQQ